MNVVQLGSLYSDMFKDCHCVEYMKLINRYYIGNGQ